jgi:hypothetical protein
VGEEEIRKGLAVAAETAQKNYRVAPISGLADFRYWHIASFRCAQQFGRFRGEADIEPLMEPDF